MFLHLLTLFFFSHVLVFFLKHAFLLKVELEQYFFIQKIIFCHAPPGMEIFLPQGGTPHYFKIQDSKIQGLYCHCIVNYTTEL